MPFSDGVFTLIYSWPNDAANGVDINADRMQAQEQDMAGNGLSICILRDGTGVPTADIPWGGFKITNLANGTDPTDNVAFGQVSPATGTFTPIDSSGASLTFTGAVGYYRKYAGFVSIWGSLTYPTTVNGSAALIGGLPFTAANLTINGTVFLGIVSFAGGFGTPSGSVVPMTLGVVKNSTTFNAFYSGSTLFTNAQLSTYVVSFQATYPI